MNCTRTCPKGLNPAKAIGEIKQLMLAGVGEVLSPSPACGIRHPRHPWRSQWPQRLMFLPALAMVALTIAVWLRMFFTRVGEMKRERIQLQAVALSAQAAARFSDTRAADNFRNLFELPVLFYLAVVVAVLTGQVTTVTVSAGVGVRRPARRA